MQTIRRPDSVIYTGLISLSGKRKPYNDEHTVLGATVSGHNMTNHDQKGFKT